MLTVNRSKQKFSDEAFVFAWKKQFERKLFIKILSISFGKILWGPRSRLGKYIARWVWQTDYKDLLFNLKLYVRSSASFRGMYCKVILDYLWNLLVLKDHWVFLVPIVHIIYSF